MTRTRKPRCTMHKWPKQWKEQIVNRDPYYRRSEIASKFGWSTQKKKGICVNRASMIMDFLRTDWPDVEPAPIVPGSRHLKVYDRVYDWCVHELLPPPPRRFYRCAVARAQALARCYLQRHTLNGHVKYSRGGFIHGAYKQRRKPNSFCYSCYAELEFTRSSRPI